MKKSKIRRCVLAVVTLALAACTQTYDVVVIGGGAGGSAAAVEAARGGARTLVVEETTWLGGVLTAAGVSAIDGNYNLRGGIFGEFADSLALRYDGYQALRSGWVSNILFNPRVGAEILENIASEAGAEIRFETAATAIQRTGRRIPWQIRLSDGTRIRARILIDGTELGDVACSVGAASLDDSRAVQDLTYVAILKEYDHEVLIEKPEGYDIDRYRSCCLNPLAENLDGNNPKGQKLWSAAQMLSYGRLPDGHIMLNWPIYGNDFYADYLALSQEQRREAFDKAKLHTLGFIYFLQHELGYTRIGIADDVFPTEDGLPFFPYFREARRIAGRDTMTVDAARNPYASLCKSCLEGTLASGAGPHSVLQRSPGRRNPDICGRFAGSRQGCLRRLGNERRRAAPTRAPRPWPGRRRPGRYRRPHRPTPLRHPRQRSAVRPPRPQLLPAPIPGSQTRRPRLPRPAGARPPRRNPRHRPHRRLGQRNLGDYSRISLPSKLLQ